MKREMKIYLHIGTHKTGSTSIQEYLNDNIDNLRSDGIDFYQGIYIENNHVELHMASMRDDRSSPFKEVNQIMVNSEYRSSVLEGVIRYLNSAPYNKIIFSAEGLSYLRYRDELSRLKQIFEGYEVYVILYLRNKHSFLDSYRKQLCKSGFSFSKDPISFAYISDDTWLIDYQSLIEIYGNSFGWDHLIILSYDNALKNDGSVLPSFLSAVGLPNRNTESYWLNRTASV